MIITKKMCAPLRVAGDMDRLPMNDVPAPRRVTIFLKQHYGRPAMPAVEVGDLVKKGQTIATSIDYLSANVHASISGEVEAISSIEDPYGGFSPAVTIKSDGRDEWHESVKPDPDYRKKSATELKTILSRAGVTTYDLEPLPLTAAIDPFGVTKQFISHIGKELYRPIDTVIVNTVDEEPMTVVNQRLFMDRGDEIGDGLWLLKQITVAGRVVVVVRSVHKRHAENFLGGVYKDNVTEIPDDYPEALPELLVKRVTGRETPAGETVRAAGALVVSFEHLLDAVEAVRDGIPNIHEMFTVGGGAAQPPKNIRVRLGTSLRDVLNFCDFREAQTAKLVLGGPMRGRAQFSMDMPVVKGVNTLLALTAAENPKIEPKHCMNCGACVDICPVHLQPNLLTRFCEFFKYDDAKFQEELPACIECGLCGFVCPAHRPMLQFIQNAKHHLELDRKGIDL
ncbi:RnfABCDGE type electron transport complex subunit C [bacterium]